MEHNRWIELLLFRIHHHSPVQATLPMCCTEPVTEQWLVDADPFLQAQEFLNEVLWFKDSLSARQTFLELHWGLIHSVHIAPSFSLLFRDVRTAFPHCLCIFLPFCLYRYFPNNLLHVAGGLYFNILISKDNRSKSWNLWMYLIWKRFFCNCG